MNGSAGWRILAVLLLANLALFGYLHYSDQPDKPTDVSADTGLTSDLVMIQELSDSEQAERRSRAAESDRPLPREIVESEPLRVCRAWGPFASQEALDRAAERMRSVANDVRVVRSQVEAAPDFLVYLETDDNPDNARRLMQELEGQNIDAYVIAGGPFVNAVSAGVFSTRDRAERLIRKLDELGYGPRLEILTRTQEVDHLIAMVPEGFELDDAPWVPCAEIASAREFL